jgi:hypothetical protein
MKHDYELITIDPGIHTGYAFFKNGKERPIYGSFSCGKEAGNERINILTSALKQVIKTGAKKCLIEGVSVYAGSVKSMASATSGKLSLLSYIVGAYFSLANQYCPSVTIIPPQWKGQIPYPALRQRIERKTGIVTINDHQLAAVGMGLWYYGKL